jgi:hypothetical protein
MSQIDEKMPQGGKVQKRDGDGKPGDVGDIGTIILLFVV